MGDSISEGTLASIMKKVGDTVAPDDIIAQIETDKVTMDVKYSGSTHATITAISVSEGDTVTVGQAVATVEEGAVAPAAPVAAVAPVAPAAPVEAAAPATPAASAAAPATKLAAPEPAKVAPAPKPAAIALQRERREPMSRLRQRVA